MTKLLFNGKEPISLLDPRDFSWAARTNPRGPETPGISLPDDPILAVECSRPIEKAQSTERHQAHDTRKGNPPRDTTGKARSGDHQKLTPTPPLMR